MWIAILIVIILLLLAEIFALLTMCRRGHSYWKLLRKYRYAHRGYHGKDLAPENSILAYKEAIRRGFGVELDVHLMQDGNLAVIHDASLLRTAGADVLVEDLTARELKAYRLEGTDEEIPLLEEVLPLFEERLKNSGIGYQLNTTGVEQEDWQNAWKKYYHAMDIGERLAIVPGWEDYRTDRIRIVMDPGMAFGTGTHETTSLCLETLDSLVKGGERVLDIGTGSGILAIAALKLGADSAEGVDIDPMCVRTAGENAARNGVADRFKVLVGDLSDKASGQYNIITANIVAAAILSLAPHVPVLMAPGARFIASGIIDERKDEVLAGLKAAGLEPVEIKEKRGWVCIICEKKEA